MTIRAHEPSYIMRMNEKIKSYGMFLDDKLRLHYEWEGVQKPIKQKPNAFKRKTFAEIIEFYATRKKRRW